MALVPVLHRILVKPQKLEEVDETYKRAAALGIQIADSDTKKREEKGVEIGTVLAVGETAFKDYGATVVPVVGDKIYYARFAGKWIKDGDEELLLLNDEDTVAIIKE